MKHLRALFTQSSLYFTSQLFVMIAGLVSFPIWTRVLSKAEYGIFSLIGVTIAMGVGFSKFGIQHAALRFHSDFKEKSIGRDISYYYTTLFFGTLFISGLLILPALLFAKTSLAQHIDRAVIEMLPLVAALIFIGSLSSILMMFIRADNRAGLHSFFAVGKRYGQLLFALVVVFYFMRNIRGLFLGYAISESIILLALIVLFAKKMNLSSISFDFFKESIRYGFPLIWMELSNMLLNFGDRYLIKYFIGSEAVGVYSAGYNAANMVQAILVAPLRLAVIPMYLKIWNKEGKEETKDFLNHTLDYYFMLGIPIIIGMSWYGKEIITLLASSKYEEAALIIPYIILALVIFGANPIFTAGLRIYKKTTVMMTSSMVAAFINIVLNIFLIPRFGIMGAAYATLIAYVVLIALVLIFSNKYLKINLHLRPILIFTALSVLTMLILSGLPGVGVIDFLVKFVLGTIIYSTGIIFFDKKIRRKLLGLINIRQK